MLVTTQTTLLWNVDPSDQTPQQTTLNIGFLTDIDWAIKQKLDTVYVSDDDAGANNRRVANFFRFPPKENLNQSWPRIAIDLLSYTPARGREQRSGDLLIPYVPTGYAPRPDDRPYTTSEAPIPYDFRYQLTATARSYPHMRDIQFQMLQNWMFPPRGGYLIVNNTIRQMFVDDDSPRIDNGETGTAGDLKRTFRAIWRLSVSGELFQKDLLAAGVPESLNITVNQFDADQLIAAD